MLTGLTVGDTRIKFFHPPIYVAEKSAIQVRFLEHGASVEVDGVTVLAFVINAATRSEYKSLEWLEV